MRVLVVEDNPIDAALIKRILASADHEVEAVVDGEAALRRISVFLPEVVVLDWGLPKLSGLEVLKQLRAGKQRGDYVYVVMSTARGTPGDLASAFAAGADDFMRKPLSREEILARVAGAARLKTHLEQATTSARRGDEEMATLIGKLPAWRSVSDVVCKEIVAMLNLQLHAAPFERTPPGARVATQRLSLPGEGLDLRFTFLVPPTSLAGIGDLLLGDRLSADQERDLLFELVNNAAGAFKRELIAENVMPTSGLPREITTEQAIEGLGDALVVQRGMLAHEGISLMYFLSASTRMNQKVSAAKLMEGMVVVHRVCNASGALLVPAGVRLTSNLAAKVSKALGPEVMVDVSAEGEE